MQNTVLVIEDSETVVELYKGLLAQFDCKVDVAQSVDEAVKFMKQFEYDVFVIDNKLQGEAKGTELIGKGGATPDKCIILSGSLPEDLVKDLMDFYRVPRDHIMIKPPNIKGFVSLVKTIFDNRNSIIEQEPEELAVKEESEDVTNDILHELKNILSIVKKLYIMYTYKFIIGIILIAFTWMFFMNVYSTYNGYQEYLSFNTSFETYCHKRFKHFVQGSDITPSTYVETITKINKQTTVIKSYPDHIISVLVTCNDSKCKHIPQLIWIPSSTYISMNGLRSDMDFVDILVYSISRSKRKLGLEDHYGNYR